MLLPAFSLAELLIVIACGCGLLLSSVPSFIQFQKEWFLWSSAHLLETSIVWGRMHAISSNSSVMLQIEPGGRRFQWCDPATGQVFVSSVRDLPGDVCIVSSPARPLRLYPRGNAAPAGTFRVQNQCGTYRVIVNIEGRVRLAKE